MHSISKAGKKRHYPLFIALQEQRAHRSVFLMSVLVGIFFLIAVITMQSFSNATTTIYTEANYGLSYDLLMQIDYDQYQYVVSHYEGETLITKPKQVYVMMETQEGIDAFVRVWYNHYQGDLCQFLSQPIEQGSCDTDSTMRGNAMIGYQLARDYDLHVFADSADLSGYVRVMNDSLLSDEIYYARIQGIQTFLKYNGYVVFDFVPVNASFGGETFLEYYQNSGDRLFVYMNVVDDTVLAAMVDDLEQQGSYVSTKANLEAALAGSQERIQENVADVTWVALGLVSLLFLVFLMDDILAYVLEKRREVGIYRAIGLPERRIARLFLDRIGIYMAYTVPIGLLAGWGVGRVALSYVFKTMGVYTWSVSNQVVIYGIAIALLTMLQGIGFAFYSLQMKRIPVAEALRDGAVNR